VSGLPDDGEPFRETFSDTFTEDATGQCRWRDRLCSKPLGGPAGDRRLVGYSGPVGSQRSQPEQDGADLVRQMRTIVEQAGVRVGEQEGRCGEFDGFFRETTDAPQATTVLSAMTT